MKVILNRSGSRVKWGEHHFRHVFIVELMEKIPEDDIDFWNIHLLPMYNEGKSNFREVSTILINNWRYNQRLINYIIERKKDKLTKSEIENFGLYYDSNTQREKSLLFDDINGEHDNFIITDIDDQDDAHGEISYGCFGQEHITAVIDYMQIISDLKKLIDVKYTQEEIHLFVDTNNLYKYTKRFLKDPNFDFWGDEY